MWGIRKKTVPSIKLRSVPQKDETEEGRSIACLLVCGLKEEATLEAGPVCCVL